MDQRMPGVAQPGLGEVERKPRGIDEMPNLLTPGEVAELFRVDPKTVTRWTNLPSCKTPGGHRRYYKEDVLPFLIASRVLEA